MPASYGANRHLARDLTPSLRAPVASSGSIATPPAFVTSAGFTIACWVKSFDFSGSQFILSESSTNGAPQFRVTTGNRLELQPRGSAGTLLSPTNTMRRGEWHRCLASWEPTLLRARIACDGEIVAESVGSLLGGSAFVQPVSALTCNSAAGTNIEDLQIWSRELTPAEILADCYSSSAPTPVARYRMQEGVGTSAADSMGGAPLALTGYVYSSDAPVSPARLLRDWASIYQAGASYLTLDAVAGNNLGVALGGVGSFEVHQWVKLMSPQASIDLLRFNTNGAVGVRLQLDGGTNLIGTVRTGPDGASAARSINATVPYVPGRWVKYTLGASISDGAAARLYLCVNGIPVADVAADFAYSPVIAWTTLTTNSQGWLGAGTAGANPIPGWVGEARVTPRMTLAQRRSMYFTGVSPVGDLLRWNHTAGVGAVSVNRGSRPGIAATLTGAAAWSLDAPW